jgi:hypothetical protein
MQTLFGGSSVNLCLEFAFAKIDILFHVLQGLEVLAGPEAKLADGQYNVSLNPVSAHRGMFDTDRNWRCALLFWQFFLTSNG